MPIDIRRMTPLLEIFDMPTSIHFYRDLLGFEVVQTSGQPNDTYGWAMLCLNGVYLMLNTAYEDDERPPEPDPQRTRAHRDTTLFFGCPDVDAAYEHLRNVGVAVQPPQLTGYGFKALSLNDPDGFGLCFQWPAA